MRVTWSDDESAAYLIDERGNIVGKWFRDRPEYNTFDPATYTYGQGYGYQAPGQQQSYMYDAWRAGGGGDAMERLQRTGSVRQGGGGYGGGAGGGFGGGEAGGFLQNQERQDWEELRRRFELTYEETVRLREENARQHDERMEQLRLESERLIMIERERMAHTTGLERQRHEYRLVELEQQHQYAVQYLQLDWTERHKQADKELGVRLQEMWSGERLAAAQMATQPQNWRVYEHWAAGLPAEAHPSGLPAGAPMFQTGPGMEGAIVPGTAPTVSPYGAALASGQRMPEFQAWGGPTTPVGDIPWTSPHKAHLGQFLESPEQFQERMYGAWRERGLTRGTATQRMYAAAPTGTAGTRVPSYG